jgi:DNA mismatch repair ATPase MutS
MPTLDFSEKRAVLNVTNGHHPILALLDLSTSVPNSLNLGEYSDSNPSGILLTGPNFRGKSVLIKMLGTLSLMAQAALPVPAESMKLSRQKIFTNFRSVDSTASAESLFFAQSKRIAQIQKSLLSKQPALYLFDEILTGTSPEEHAILERNVLMELAAQKAMFVFASHQRDLASLEKVYPGVLINRHMSDSDDPGRKYRIEEGPSSLRNALQVMLDAGVSAEFVGRARAELESLYLDLVFR